jgi:hypothetical protein
MFSSPTWRSGLLLVGPPGLRDVDLTFWIWQWIDDAPGQFREEAPETLPAKDNTQSTMVHDVDPDKPQVFDFELRVPWGDIVYREEH